MAICKITRVAQARKTPGSCVICHKPIEAGEPYQWWSGRFTPKHVAHITHTIEFWRLETNPTRQEVMQAEDELEAVRLAAENPEEAVAGLRAAMEYLEGVKATLEERISGWRGTNLENSGQSDACSSTVDEFDAWLSNAERWASDLDTLAEHWDEEPVLDPDADEDIDDDADPKADALALIVDEIEDIPELDMGI